LSQTRKAKTVTLLLQGLAVLGSVLLAFSIDAWWEGHSERATETAILESLRAELLVNQERVVRQSRFMRGLEESALAVLSREAQNPSEVPSDSLDHLIGDLTFGATSAWVTATLDALVSSGDLSLIPDRDLRAEISLWARFVDQTEDFEAMQNDFLSERLLPFLSSRADLARLTNAYSDEPGTGLSIPGYQEFRMVSSDVEHRALLEDREFRNLVVQLYWNVTDMQAQYQRFEATLVDLLGDVGEPRRD
jgi:hypothetical protein